MREHDQVCHAGVGDLVEGVTAGAAHLHVTAVGKARQVGGDAALRQADVGDTFGDGAFAVEQEFQQPEPG